MAIFNEILSGRFNRSLQKIFAIKGKPPVRQLGGEIMPVHVISSQNENLALEEWYRFGIVSLTAAIAATQAAHRFRNPANSNRLVVIEKIVASDDTAATPSIVDLQTQTTNQDLGSPVTVASNCSWDKRLNVASVMSLSNAASGVPQALTLSRCHVNIPGASQFEFVLGRQQEIILSPGEAIQVFYGAVNIATGVAWWWRERKFEPEELNLG